MSRQTQTLQAALESVNAESTRVKNAWASRLEAIDAGRTKIGMNPMDPWTRAVVAATLETYTKACDRRDALSAGGFGRVTEATNPADVSFLRTHGINILTATMPSLIANDLVSVQPLQARVGEVRYLDVVYGDNKGAIKAGDTMFSNTRVGGPTGAYNYTYDQVDNEELLFDADKKLATLAWIPVAPGTVAFTADAKDYTDNGAGKLLNNTTEVGEIDYATGTIKLTTALTNADEIACDYRYDNITAPAEAPEMNLRIKGIPVIARSRKLKTITSFDAMFDLQAQYGFDSSAEQATLAAQYLQYEIDGEITTECFNSASAKETTFSSTVPNAVSKLDHYEGFISVLNEASNNIFEETRFATGTYMVAGLDAATIMESLANRGFVASGQTANGPHMIGKMGNYSVYKTPQLVDTKGAIKRDGYYMGYKGDSLFHAGYIYAPYMPIMTTDLLAQDNFQVSQGYATAYAKKVVNSKLFSKGAITSN